jgi:hypothetical protein
MNEMKMTSKYEENVQTHVEETIRTRRAMRYTDQAIRITYFLLRVVAGLLFMQSGGLILFGWFGGMPGQPSPPPLLSQTGIGGY